MVHICYSTIYKCITNVTHARSVNSSVFDFLAKLALYGSFTHYLDPKSEDVAVSSSSLICLLVECHRKHWFMSSPFCFIFVSKVMLTLKKKFVKLLSWLFFIYVTPLRGGFIMFNFWSIIKIILWLITKDFFRSFSIS